MIESAPETTFVHLFDEHHRAVLAYFLRRLDRDDAYDATADVFVVAWRRLDDVPQGEEALPWLYGVARRVLSNQLRGVRRADRLVAKLSHLRGDELARPRDRGGAAGGGSGHRCRPGTTAAPGPGSPQARLLGRAPARSHR